MSISFESPAEAFAAIATIVVAADNAGSMEERDFLFNQMNSLEIFKEYDQAAFNKLMGDVTERIYSSFPVDGTCLSCECKAAVVAAVKDALTPELRTEALKIATGLANADGMAEEEKNLLAEIQAGLGVDPA